MCIRDRHESDLELDEECILSEGIKGRIVRHARSVSLVVPEFIIELNLRLDFRWEIFKVIREAKNGSRVQVVGHTGAGVELFVHDGRFPVLKGTVGNQIFGQHVPRTSLRAGGSGSTADRLVEAGPVSRPTDRGLVGTVMALPPFALHHESRDNFRGIAEIQPVPVERSLAASVDIGIGVVRLALNGGEADPGHV